MSQDTYAALRAIDALLFFAAAAGPGERRDAFLGRARQIVASELTADERKLAAARDLRARLARLDRAAGVPL